ncbi:type VI secretion system protein ImpA [Luteibacter sp. Sphag1AF]|uniref:type VI secretion system protein TssA n=1 Tax=Luteibacter sp. Sphag1AF TaxID=2587031 RepID=UPI001615E44F|nr:type VI secretion system protein TssA [Luteibacter sp. Sphag1AF]MBB3228147.1 type VI secretion system protein ImpA [Luteibacter sp. Sphag1AF]
MDTTDSLLEALDVDAPCGPNLEYDAAFLALEMLAAPRPERAVGDSVKCAEEPEWRDVARQAEQLWERTRDLRIAIHLGNARLKTSGIAAWAQSIGLVEALLQRYWSDVHPQLDDNDPVERVNALAALAAVDGTVGYLRSVPLLRAERIGAFSLRDLRVLNGSLKPGDGAMESAPVSQEMVDAVAQQVEVDVLVTTEAAIAAALAHVRAIGRMFEERTPGMGPDFDALERDLREIDTFLRAQVAMRAPQALVQDAGADVATCSADHTDTTVATAAHGPVRNTDDVLRMLDEICAWYSRHEPSSPVPPLLRRASRLVGLSFTELLRTLAPGGVSEFQHLSGDEGAG